MMMIETMEDVEERVRVRGELLKLSLPMIKEWCHIRRRDDKQ